MTTSARNTDSKPSLSTTASGATLRTTQRLTRRNNFEHTMDRKTMSHDSLLVLPKPVKTGISIPNCYSYRGIRSSWSSVNLSNMRRNVVSYNLEPTTPTKLQRSRSPVYMTKGRQWDDDNNAEMEIKEQEKIFSSNSFMSGKGFRYRRRIDFADNDDENDDDISRTPSPIIGRMDLDSDEIELYPERSTSPNTLECDASHLRKERMSTDFGTPISSCASSPEILQVASEIQNILFQQQRKSIEEKDLGGALEELQSEFSNRRSDDERSQNVHGKTSAILHPRTIDSNDADDDDEEIFSVELEDSLAAVSSVALMDDDDGDDDDRYGARNTFRPFDYDGDDVEEEGEHMTSISTDAIQLYLDEYSLHDNCPSPPVRVYNGIAFDNYFQHRNHSHFSADSFERLEGVMTGAELGLFSISPVSSQQVH